jgi:hypothetical protein
VFFVGLRRLSADPQFVIKFRHDGEWNPKAEFDGLEKVTNILKLTDSTKSYCSVKPVYYSLDPPCLVTEFQPGISLQPVFTRAIRRRHQASIQLATGYSKRIAHWIRLVQSDKQAQDPDLIVGEWVETVKASGEHLERRIPRLKGIASRVLKYGSQLSKLHLEKIGYAHANRGDCRPANFLACGQRIVAFDLEGFGYGSLGLDSVAMRNYFAFESAGNRRSREVAQSLWQAYVEDFMDDRLYSSVILLGYLKSLFLELSQMLHKPMGLNPRKILARWQWIEEQVSWLSGLSGSLDSDSAYLIQRL